MDGTGETEQVPYTRVTVAEAASALGVTVVTIRRMIKRGQLEGERVIRPQGSAYLVKLPRDGTGDATSTEQVAQDMSRTQGTAPAPAAEAMVSLIQTTIATVLGPLVAELAASRQTNERQADRIAELERENGRLTERLESATPAHSPVAADLTPEVPEATTDAPLAVWRSWRGLAPWLLGLVLAIGAVVVLLAWGR
jgi:excisionase family DNA binding protein